MHLNSRFHAWLRLLCCCLAVSCQNDARATQGHIPVLRPQSQAAVTAGDSVFRMSTIMSTIACMLGPKCPAAILSCPVIVTLELPKSYSWSHDQACTCVQYTHAISSVSRWWVQLSGVTQSHTQQQPFSDPRVIPLSSFDALGPQHTQNCCM